MFAYVFESTTPWEMALNDPYCTMLANCTVQHGILTSTQMNLEARAELTRHPTAKPVIDPH